MNTKLDILELSSFLNGKTPGMAQRSSIELLASLFEIHFIDIKEIKQEQCTILFIASGGSEEKFLQIESKLPKPIILVSDSYNNSLPAALEISSWLHSKGKSFSHINIPSNPSQDFVETLELQIHETAKIQKALSAISNYKIALIGGESPWLISSKTDISYISDYYGPVFFETSTESIEREFFQEHCDDDESQKLIKMLSSSSKAPCIDEKSVAEAVKLYKVLKRFTQNNNVDALTIKCFDFLDSCKTTACLALALLNDQGIVCGCEGDIPSLWSMIVAKEICGGPTFMANPSSINVQENSIDFAHCTAPLSMGEQLLLDTHYESGIGIGIASSIKPGEYTLFKNSGELLEKSYCFHGEIIQNTNIAERCRTQVKFRFHDPNDLEKFKNTFLGNHTILIPGNHKQTLEKFISI